MICNKCEELGHYWFANDDEELDKETAELIGIYAWCDMRQVYNTDVKECECGCHKVKETK